MDLPAAKSPAQTAGPRLSPLVVLARLPASGETHGPFGLRRDLIRYLCVGVLNTFVGLSTIYAAIYIFHLRDVPANLIGYALGIGCSFMLNKHWTFSSTGSLTSQFAKFLLVLSGAYLVNLATVMCLIKLLGINRYVAQALGILPYTAIGYLGSRHFTFRSSPTASRTVAPRTSG
jgi:putative flippase GtrA